MTSAVPKVTNAKKATTSQSRLESLSMLHPLSRINYAAAAFIPIGIHFLRETARGKPSPSLRTVENYVKFLLYDNLVVAASQAVASSIIVACVGCPAIAASAQFKEKLESAP